MPIKRIPEFITRILTGAGAIHADGNIEPKIHNDFDDATMQNMMTRGSLVPGDELEAGNDEASRMEDKLMKDLFDGEVDESNSGSDSSSEVDD